MKLLPLALLALMLAGCDDDKPPNLNQPSFHRVVELDGHRWIENVWNSKIPLVHSPSCPCRKEVER